jgi:hypothetical protein
MKRILAAAVFMMAALGNCAASGFMSGAKFMELAPAFDRGMQRNGSPADQADGIQLASYLMGVYDFGQGIFFCSPPSVGATQLVAVARKYIAERPERWNERASNLITESLTTAFPCVATK